MTPRVVFVGAGPGDPELITVRGRRLIREADAVCYAGSLVPEALAREAKPGAVVADSSSMTLEQTHQLLADTVRAGGLAVRLHTGDPSLYGAVREQAVLLDREGIEYEIVPGVTAAFAAAAAAKASFTTPGATQSLTLTRAAGRTPVPERESLEAYAAHGAGLAVYLSAGDPQQVQDELLRGGYPPDTPVAAAHRVGWPGEQVLRIRMDELAETAREHGMRRQTVFLILPGEAAPEQARSKLYDPGFAHGRRDPGGEPGDG
jgi:precorrin-4/cobalt-precorrin-4 C11-methyltransferase